MENDFVNLININQNEVLRYLEYKGQDISDNLNSTINECRELTKNRMNPRYIIRVYPIKKNKSCMSINEEYTNDSMIELEGINFKLESRDIYNLLKDCDECIIMAATLGIEVERDIRKYSYMDLTKGIIIDSCATTAIEEVCDLIQKRLEIDLLKIGKYITTRYSPGYGDLPIEKNIDIINILNAQKEIGLTITQSGIMIPRKSVVAIIGVSNSIVKKTKKSCENCKNNSNCKYKREVEGCGYQGIYKR